MAHVNAAGATLLAFVAVFYLRWAWLIFKARRPGWPHGVSLLPLLIAVGLIAGAFERTFYAAARMLRGSDINFWSQTELVLAINGFNILATTALIIPYAATTAPDKRHPVGHVVRYVVAALALSVVVSIAVTNLTPL